MITKYYSKFGPVITFSPIIILALVVHKIEPLPIELPDPIYLYIFSML